MGGRSRRRFVHGAQVVLHAAVVHRQPRLSHRASFKGRGKGRWTARSWRIGWRSSTREPRRGPVPMPRDPLGTRHRQGQHAKWLMRKCKDSTILGGEASLGSMDLLRQSFLAKGMKSCCCQIWPSSAQVSTAFRFNRQPRLWWSGPLRSSSRLL